MRKNILIFAGILGVILGTVWLLQGLALLRVPADSTMIGEKAWAIRGGVLAAISAILVAGVRLVPDKRSKD